MMFPSCWCANRLPVTVVNEMETAYRTELVAGCPEAQDDATFNAALGHACAFWLFTTLDRHLQAALEEDRQGGIATMRPRLLGRLDAFIATTEALHQLPAMRGVASRLREALDRLWAGTPPLPLYPAFRDDEPGGSPAHRGAACED